MGKLIDVDLVLDNLSGRLESMKDYDAVKDVINNMPTAYDVNKVVEQLKTSRNCHMRILKSTQRNMDYQKMMTGITGVLEEQSKS